LSGQAKEFNNLSFLSLNKKEKDFFFISFNKEKLVFSLVEGIKKIL
jgi:hypothetical protein